jgi:uncharacterized membrane protein YkoI
MTDKLKGVLLATAVLAALAVGGATIAAAGDDGPRSDRTAQEESDDDAREGPDDDAREGPDDDAGEADERVGGRDGERAGNAALKAAGPGKVTEVERADEGETGYEVEVRRSDGSFAEVALDRSFAVTSVEEDDD